MSIPLIRRQKSSLSNKRLAALIEEWITSVKPCAITLGNKYGIHPRSVFKLLRKHYYGRVNNGISIVLESAINTPADIIDNIELAYDVVMLTRQQREELAVKRYKQDSNITMYALAKACGLTYYQVNRVIDKFLNREYSEVA